jgi:drug/metabolite transporter (DMT)-like permease
LVSEIRGLIRGMWIVYALAAAIIWGISYAASGRVIERGMTPLVFFFLYTFFGAAAAAVALAVTGKTATLVAEFRSLENDWVWLLVAIVSSAAGGLLIYIAIGEKNATLASLIEISYPFFVAVFAWLFFRDVQFSWQTLMGGLLILGGVGVVFLAESN